jgi:MFS family permease
MRVTTVAPGLGDGKELQDAFTKARYLKVHVAFITISRCSAQVRTYTAKLSGPLDHPPSGPCTIAKPRPIAELTLQFPLQPHHRDIRFASQCNEVLSHLFHLLSRCHSPCGSTYFVRHALVFSIPNAPHISATLTRARDTVFNTHNLEKGKSSNGAMDRRAENQRLDGEYAHGAAYRVAHRSAVRTCLPSSCDVHSLTSRFTWNVEMTYCTPYLLELGLTKSKISLVWVAGPLSGLIMQPIVGVVADRSTSRFGRRRPFMLGGTVLVAIFLLLLGWTKEVVRYFVADEEVAKSRTVVVAVLSIYGIDFAINAVQGSCRGLVVDTLPGSKQQQGMSWASRMVAVGSLVGYGAGAVDLKRVFGGWLGDTQFKQLTGVAAITLCVAVGTTSWAVTERVRVQGGEDDEEGISAVEVVRTIVKTAVDLPRGIQAICAVQFWAWIGTFGCVALADRELTAHRLVPLPLLQHHVGWRDLPTLRCTGRGQKLW